MVVLFSSASVTSLISQFSFLSKQRLKATQLHF